MYLSIPSSYKNSEGMIDNVLFYDELLSGIEGTGYVIVVMTKSKVPAVK